MHSKLCCNPRCRCVCLGGGGGRGEKSPAETQSHVAAEFVSERLAKFLGAAFRWIQSSARSGLGDSSRAGPAGSMDGVRASALHLGLTPSQLLGIRASVSAFAGGGLAHLRLCRCGVPQPSGQWRQQSPEPQSSRVPSTVHPPLSRPGPSRTRGVGGATSRVRACGLCWPPCG